MSAVTLNLLIISIIIKMVGRFKNLKEMKKEICKMIFFLNNENLLKYFLQIQESEVFFSTNLQIFYEMSSPLRAPLIGRGEVNASSPPPRTPLHVPDLERVLNNKNAFYLFVLFFRNDGIVLDNSVRSHERTIVPQEQVFCGSSHDPREGFVNFAREY